MLSKATFFMRAVVLFIGIVVLIFSIFLFPEILRETAIIAAAASLQISPWFAFINFTFPIGLYAASIPFFIALYQTLKLLSYIDKKKAFSELSVKILKNIKYCALAICALYMAGVMPIIYCFAKLDDAPGLVLMGLVIGFTPIVIATFAAILQKLLQEAIDIKSENDLTI
ncbi:DUF2975 domain-containing protein [Caproiciproducens galactitolivorans]|uniref:DUF2975 domain-containing protein n=1 Tax=Caproiciproducens galactitolivorans TaxID=642589 RepID=A0ABT4BT15_9FIRM|nr:DUF2975 domain-containing protein [Caproiciproducens galactitolivorans]MCY1714032.1 DUF2975 domain-containing protein [Caproiciproducens galactitolivorans]